MPNHVDYTVIIHGISEGFAEQWEAMSKKLPKGENLPFTKLLGVDDTPKNNVKLVGPRWSLVSEFHEYGHGFSGFAAWEPPVEGVRLFLESLAVDNPGINAVMNYSEEQGLYRGIALYSVMDGKVRVREISCSWEEGIEIAREKNPGIEEHLWSDDGFVYELAFSIIINYMQIEVDRKVLQERVGDASK